MPILPAGRAPKRNQGFAAWTLPTRRRVWRWCGRSHCGVGRYGSPASSGTDHVDVDEV